MASVLYGERMGVPVVLDMRDMWPDIFIEVLPPLLKAQAHFLLQPFVQKAHNACARATAIIGITEAFVEWGLKRGGRTRSEWDRAFPFVYPADRPRQDAIENAAAFWDAQGVRGQPSGLRVCFFGNLSRQLDVFHFIEAARILCAIGYPTQFVVCGTGERLQKYHEAAANVPGIIFPGWVDAAKIHVLMQRSNVGLDPLPDRYDFLASINNKAVEYMSAALPIISSPRRGVLCDLLRDWDCGWTYDAGDAKGLVSLLKTLHDDQATLVRMSANAARVFNRHFVAEKVCDAMAGHLEHIARACRSAPEMKRVAAQL
jgi:glycosyltransferase involved in cell wall biosynthesis